MSKPLPDPIERESRELWALGGNGLPKLVTGYVCENAPGYWWVPTEGASMCIGYSLWESEDDAKAAAIKKAEADHADAMRRLDALDVWAVGE